MTAGSDTRKSAPATTAPDKVAAKDAPKPKREELIDKASKDSFPASDPPSFMGAAATGGPKRGTVKPGQTQPKAN